MVKTDIEKKYENWILKYPYSLDTDEMSNFLSDLKNIKEYDTFPNEDDSLLACIKLSHRKRFNTLKNNINQRYLEFDGEIDIESIYLEPLEGNYKSYIKMMQTSYSEKELVVEGYSAEDINILEEETARFPWQNDLYKLLYNQREHCFNKLDSRQIIWIYDSAGCTGKLLFLKWLHYKNSKDVSKLVFGNITQMRNAIVNTNPKKCYVIDIPRSKAKTDRISVALNAIEEVKNGYISSVMYGSLRTRMFDTPHVVVFSNDRAPRELLSQDRWVEYKILSKDKTLVNIKPSILQKINKN